MADQFFYARGQEQFGPFSPVQLKELAADGRILPTDLVWKEGMANRVPATKVKNLFPSPAAAGAAAAGPSAAPSSPSEAPAQPTPEEASPKPGPEKAPAAKAAETGAASVLVPGSNPEPEAQVVPAANKPGPGKDKPRAGRAEAVRGAIIMSVDGTLVRFRKKCIKCGHEDNSKSTIPMRNGSTRTGFYCPKCRKLRDVEIRCYT